MKAREKKQISLAQNKSKPKKCVCVCASFNAFDITMAPNLRDKMLDFRVIILHLDVKIKCENMRHNMARRKHNICSIEFESKPRDIERESERECGKNNIISIKRYKQPNRIGLPTWAADWMAMVAKIQYNTTQYIVPSALF